MNKYKIPCIVIFSCLHASHSIHQKTWPGFGPGGSRTVIILTRMDHSNKSFSSTSSNQGPACFLWLANNGHVTWILASDWSVCFLSNRDECQIRNFMHIYIYGWIFHIAFSIARQIDQMIAQRMRIQHLMKLRSYYSGQQKEGLKFSLDCVEIEKDMNLHFIFRQKFMTVLRV